MAQAHIKHIAVSTGGGDCPGLNAVIRAVVNTAAGYGWRVTGIEDSFNGLLNTARTRPLGIEDVKEILTIGGTVLGTTNKGNPFHYPVDDSSGQFQDVSDTVVQNFHNLELDAMIVIGGDGTQKIAAGLMDKGIPVVGVPKTIDNDLAGTDLTFGFSTAVRTATDVLDKLHSTARSHHRVMVVEMMGREAGWIALHAGLAGNAHAILIPEIPFSMDKLADHLRRRWDAGDRYSIVVVAEGAAPLGGQMAVSGRAADGTVHLSGIGQQIGTALGEATGYETRVTVLGHIQRGGSPTAFDRILATRFGEHAVTLVSQGRFGRLVTLNGWDMGSVAMSEVIDKTRRIEPATEPVVDVARKMGIHFGDS